jgi:uncharacterized protein (TIGR02284 family)
MANSKEIINDLEGLIDICNDGTEGYDHACKSTDSIELQGVFLKLSAQRTAYANELKEHISDHGGDSKNDTGGVMGALHRSWIDFKQVFTSKDDIAILSAIETGEQAAIEKYDLCIIDYPSHKDHLELLKKQRFGIAEALREIQSLRIQFEQR